MDSGKNCEVTGLGSPDLEASENVGKNLFRSEEDCSALSLSLPLGDAALSAAGSWVSEGPRGLQKAVPGASGRAGSPYLEKRSRQCLPEVGVGTDYVNSPNTGLKQVIGEVSFKTVSECTVRSSNFLCNNHKRCRHLAVSRCQRLWWAAWKVVLNDLPPLEFLPGVSTSPCVGTRTSDPFLRKRVLPRR